VALRIAFDLDGVLADMESVLARHAAALFRNADAMDADNDEGPPPDAPAVTLNLSTRQQRRLWRHVQSIENFWESLPELEPGVVAALASMAAEKRWEVIFLTKRPETAGRTAQLQTQRWLAAKGFPLPSVFVVQGSRGRVASSLALDIVIDDRIENCLDVVVDSTARAILVWRDSQERLPGSARRLGIGVVKSTRECLRLLGDSHSPASARKGLMLRVMRALGLKEQAGA
jgi:uncharacterized protein